MADMERLLRRRVAAKGWATRAANQLADLLDEKAEMVVERRLAIGDAQKECAARLTTLDDLQAEIECLLDPAALETDLEAAWTFRESVKSVILRAEQEVARKEAAVVGGSSAQAGARLPKLELPRFDGELEKWPIFWESFCSCVDGRVDLADVTKLTYLRSLLRGEASSCVAGLALTGVNYRTACDLLVKRFGRPERLVFVHIQALLNLSVGQDLHKLQDSLLVHVRSLAALQVEGDRYGMFLTPLVLSKLPEDVRLEWARDAEGKESDLDHLLQFLASEVDRRDRSGSYCHLGQAASAAGAGVRASGRTCRAGAADVQPAAPSRLPGPVRPTRPSTAALQSAAPAASGCGLCREQHSTDKCRGWVKLTISERYEQVRKHGLCFCCLQGGHLARRCAARCVRCDGRHHMTVWQWGRRECAGAPRRGRRCSCGGPFPSRQWSR